MNQLRLHLGRLCDAIESSKRLLNGPQSEIILSNTFFKFALKPLLQHVNWHLSLLLHVMLKHVFICAYMRNLHYTVNDCIFFVCVCVCVCVIQGKATSSSQTQSRTMTSLISQTPSSSQYDSRHGFLSTSTHVICLHVHMCITVHI